MPDEIDIGDKVRVVDEYSGLVGRIGEVIAISKDFYEVQFNKSSYLFYLSELEKVAIGDCES